MATLRVVANLKSHDETAAELRSLLEGLVEPTRAEPKCISYELLERLDDPTEFTFVEEWQDEAALDSHFETPHIVAALERMPELLAAELDLRKYLLVR